jgi:pyruvate-formate lyase-activating enzyme
LIKRFTIFSNFTLISVNSKVFLSDSLARVLHDQCGSYNILFTNGLKLPDLSDVDEVIVSLKAITPEIYRDYTGADNAKTLSNFRRIYEMGKKLQAEILFVPGVVEEDEIEKAAGFVASVSRDIPFRINGYLEVNGVPYRAALPAEVQKAAAKAEKHLAKVNHLSADMPRVGEKTIRVF